MLLGICKGKKKCEYSIQWYEYLLEKSEAGILIYHPQLFTSENKPVTANFRFLPIAGEIHPRIFFAIAVVE
jgi:hypothetical protein